MCNKIVGVGFNSACFGYLKSGKHCVRHRVCFIMYVNTSWSAFAMQVIIWKELVCIQLSESIYFIIDMWILACALVYDL